MAATETLNIVITTKAQGDGAKKTESGLKNLVSAAKAFAGVAIAKKVAEFTVEMTKLGAQSQAAALRFERFAGGTREASAMLDAFNEGTQDTVDRMTGMASAAKLMQMGLVETTDEMTMVTSMATKLGDQTMAAGDRISDFAAMLANQSIPRLDNFGISSGRVRERINELLESGKALNREQAFKMAVMEEGAKALERLGDTSETTLTKIDKMSAAWKDTKTAVGEAIATIVDATGALDRGAEGTRTYADQARIFSDTITGLKDGTIAWADLLKATTISMKDGAEAGNLYLQSLLDMRQGAIGAADGHQYLRGEYERAIPQKVRLVGLTNDSTLAHEQYQAALDATARSQDKAAQAALALAESEEEARAATQRHSEYLFEASMTFTDLYRRQAETAEDYNESIEEAEKKHQEKLVELAKKGQSTAVRINADAEQAKLNEMRRDLEIALQQQAEFTDKTKASTQMRKNDQIVSLQSQITQQEQLLDDYHAGRLVRAGQNVDALVAEENRRYDEEMAALQESRAEQEAEQQRSLGRMVLQHFTSWAEMTGLTADETLKMQLDISEKYGLIESDAADKVGQMTNNWAAQLSIMRGDASSFFDAFTKEFNALPSEHVVKIRYEMSGRPETEAGRMGGEAQQTGTNYFRGGWAVVGERGPELVRLPTGSAVFNAGRTQGMLGGREETTVSIGPVYITNSDPGEIWKQLERYARLKGKSGWRLGR